MPAFKQPTFADRRTHAADAKASLIERYRTRPGPDDPRVVALTAERKRLHDERLARQAMWQQAAEDERAREVEARKVSEEQQLEAALARQAEADAKTEAARQARRERLAANAVTSADQKALRDARYAVRKSRQKR